MQQHRGFALIEVMIAFILLSIMAAGLLPLSQRYLTYSRDGRDREIAMRLAESKLDELRHLAYLNQSSMIVSGQSTQTMSNTAFSLNWTVTAFDWNPTQQAWQSVIADEYFSGKKDVSVTITWLDTRDADQSLVLNTALVALPTLSAGPFGHR